MVYFGVYAELFSGGEGDVFYQFVWRDGSI